MHVLKSALIGISLAVSAAPALTIVPDTVDLRTNQNPAAGPFIVNAGSDSLIVDSLAIRAISIKSQSAQIVFYLRAGTSPNYTVNRQYLGSYPPSSFFISSPNGRFAIPPQTTLQLLGPAFDECILCPTAKRAATAAIGDTLKARLIVYAPSGKDSVLFLSIQRLSSGIVPLRPGARGKQANRYVDPAGRKAAPVRAVPRLAVPEARSEHVVP